jgi:carbon storage regulator
MLILTRKPGESVVIGNSIRVTVVGCSSGAVRLGFEAPGDVSIYRDEVFREIAAANRAAAGDAGDAHCTTNSENSTSCTRAGSTSAES